jgi:hypothetical protein
VLLHSPTIPRLAGMHQVTITVCVPMAKHVMFCGDWECDDVMVIDASQNFVVPQICCFRHKPFTIPHSSSSFGNTKSILHNDRHYPRNKRGNQHYCCSSNKTARKCKQKIDYPAPSSCRLFAKTHRIASVARLQREEVSMIKERTRRSSSNSTGFYKQGLASSSCHPLAILLTF